MWSFLIKPPSLLKGWGWLHGLISIQGSLGRTPGSISTPVLVTCLPVLVFSRMLCGLLRGEQLFFVLGLL